MKNKKKLKMKTSSKIKTKAEVKQPKFYTAEKQGSRFDVIKSLLESNQLKLNTVYTSKKIESLEVKLYGKKDKVENLSPFKMYVPINRDTHKSLKSVLGIDLEVIKAENGKAVEYRFVKLNKKR